MREALQSDHQDAPRGLRREAVRERRPELELLVRAEVDAELARIVPVSESADWHASVEQ